MLINPDFYVGGKENPYLLRWYLTPWSGWWRFDKNGNPRDFNTLNKFQKWVRSLPNVYLHKFLRDDDDRALHDHPWPSTSIILRGGYIEHRFIRKPRENMELSPTWAKSHKPWTIEKRKADEAHRIELYRDCPGRIPNCNCAHEIRPAWTIFITGKKVRDWGFWCTRDKHTVSGEVQKVARFVPWQDFVSASDVGNVGKGCGEQ